MDDSSANLTAGKSLISNDFYGYLKHPSGLMLPKVLRDQLQQSILKEKGEDIERSDDSNDTMYEEITIRRHQDQNRERYWSVTEIVDMINATSQKIQNVQTQIIHGEDYYVNNVASISVYNSKNNYSDSTTFLDSKTDSTSANNYPGISNAGGNAATNSYGMNSNNNQHRWFSSSFTNTKPYQQTMPYPTILRKEKISSLSLSSSIPDDSSSTFVTAAPLIPATVQTESDVQVATGITDAMAASAEMPTASHDTVTTTVSKRGRNVTVQPPPARRSTKRRRKA